MAALGTTGVVLLAAVHLTQGTSVVAAADLWALFTGSGTDQAAAIVVASRMPRLLAGLVVGVALGAARAAAPPRPAGRAVIAPAQLPAELLTAVVGTPYFGWLLWRSRAPVH